MFLLKKIVAALVLPPTGPVLLALCGVWLATARSRRLRNAGIGLATLSLAALLIVSLPVVGRALTAPLETLPPLAAEQLRRVQAIVVLGGGSYFNAPEYGRDVAGAATLERLRYGATLARRSGLPLLVTGGAPFGGRPEAEAMREVLEDDFGLKVRWIEPASRDTAENAALSAPLLKAAGISRIALVSHARHLPRAVPLFAQQGFEVLPAPTAFGTAPPDPAADWLPGLPAAAREAANEYLGRLVNRIKEP